MTELTATRPIRLEDGTMPASIDSDLRRHTVRDRTGKAFGCVESLFLDKQGGQVRLLYVHVDKDVVDFDQRLFIPIEAVSQVEDHSVWIDDVLEHIVRSPAYDELSLDDDRYWHELYDFYGFTPYWAPGVGAG